MSAAKDLQSRIHKTLLLPGSLSIDIPIVSWRKKNTESNMEATIAAQTGRCIYVLTPVPTSAMQGASFVFFDGFECRVQIVEFPDVPQGDDIDLSDLIEEVALALHWQPKSVTSPLYGILAHPLSLAPRPVDITEGVVAVPGFERNGEVVKGADVIFNAALQINNR